MYQHHFHEKFEQRSDLWSRYIQSDPSLDARPGAILIVWKRKEMTRKTWIFQRFKNRSYHKKCQSFHALTLRQVSLWWMFGDGEKKVNRSELSFLQLAAYTLCQLQMSDWNMLVLPYLCLALVQIDLPTVKMNKKIIWKIQNCTEASDWLRYSVEMSSMFCTNRR